MHPTGRSRPAGLLAGLLCLACVGAGAPVRPGGDAAVVVHRADFERPPGPQWSVRKTEVTPKGRRTFLGRFGNGEVKLTLTDLPAHTYLRVSFELFIIRTWDGSASGVGPDLWSLNVQDGPELLRCTFANGVAPGCDTQSFPDGYPGPAHPRQTGAHAVATLGYKTNHPLEGDSVYRLSVTFGHAGPDVALIFAAAGLEDLDNESWGLDNVKVEALPASRKLTRQQLQQGWEQLGGGDPVRAWAALWTLVDAGDAAADLAARRLKPVEPDGDEVRRLIGRLDSDNWKQRRQAGEALKRMGRSIVPLLKTARQGKVSAEVAQRIDEMLERFSGESLPPSEQVRYSRILRLLEVLASKRSLDALNLIRRTGPSERVQARATGAAARVADGLAKALETEAAARARRLDFEGAAEQLREALKLVRTVDPLAGSDIDVRIQRMTALAGVHERATTLEAAVKARPADRRARRELIRTLLVLLDSPASAAGYADERSDPVLRKNVRLAARDPEQLSGSECLVLARWYEGLAKDAGRPATGAMLRRARAYYSQYARKMGQAAAEAQNSAQRLDEELARLETPVSIDALKHVRPPLHVVSGQWAPLGAGVQATSASISKLTVPVAPRGDYELLADIVCKQGGDSSEINFHLPIGPTGVLLTVFPATGRGQLQNVDGGERDFKAAAPRSLRDGRRHRLHVVIRSEAGRVRLLATVDGSEIIRWEGPASSLEVNRTWAMPHPELLGLGAHACTAVFERLRLRMLSGRAETVPNLRPARRLRKTLPR
ncbi:MAG: hypothetical protein ACYS5V_01945 [Planctomycetota bacterium]|jgi:hypothetical protein